MSLKDFAEIWCVDFEFYQPDGEIPDPICLVAHEIRSGRWLKLLRSEMGASPPYSTSENSLFVAFANAAEFSCHLSLRWPLPSNTIDLFFEFRRLTNSVDKAMQKASSLLAACAHFHIPHVSDERKEKMRKLASRGGPWTQQEKNLLLEYCQTDIIPLPALLEKLTGNLNEYEFNQALERGRYSKAVARIEYNGIPVDTEILGELGKKWVNIQRELIFEVDRDFHVYEDTHFRLALFEGWLRRHGIAWPRTKSGRLSIEDKTFRSMASTYPSLHPLKELRATLSSLKLWSLATGSDGRNRTSLKPFASITSRNQPSNSKFIFGPATWIRSLIMPRAGCAVAYIDYEQEEFFIAACLSGDKSMQETYLAGDPHMEFAKQANAVPPHATKKTHGAIRDQYKQCNLGVMYGMAPKALALRIGKSENVAQQLIEKHQQTYPQFWAWTDRVLSQVQLEKSYSTESGWQVKNTGKLNEHEKRSLRNYPVQSTGADILRLACCLGIEAGIKICAPVHDAVLIEAPLDKVARHVFQMQAIMAEASRQILGNGFELRTEAKVFTDRLEDPRGLSTWNLVRKLLERCREPEEQFELGGLFTGTEGAQNDPY